ncbi:MAG: hypothetical protein AAB011_05595 [Candidatus Eisenbacteria bacterium]
MSTPHDSITLTLDRRLLTHPRAYHLRKMRLGLWLYLALLARLKPDARTVEVGPAAVGAEMGLAEGTVRSWLGHLRAAGYLDAERLNGTIRVTIHRGSVPEESTSEPQRFFTATKLERAINDRQNREAFEAAIRDHPDEVIRRALAGALAVPPEKVRRSRTALFLYLLNRYAHEH